MTPMLHSARHVDHRDQAGDMLRCVLQALLDPVHRRDLVSLSLNVVLLQVADARKL